MVLLVIGNLVNWSLWVTRCWTSLQLWLSNARTVVYIQCCLRRRHAAARLRLVPTNYFHLESSHVFRLLHYYEGTMDLVLRLHVCRLVRLLHSRFVAVAMRGATPAPASHLHRHCVGVLGGSALLLPPWAFIFWGELIALYTCIAVVMPHLFMDFKKSF